jgi:hypothetical protein
MLHIKNVKILQCPLIFLNVPQYLASNYPCPHLLLCGAAPGAAAAAARRTRAGRGLGAESPFQARVARRRAALLRDSAPTQAIGRQRAGCQGRRHSRQAGRRACTGERPRAGGPWAGAFGYVLRSLDAEGSAEPCGWRPCPPGPPLRATPRHSESIRVTPSRTGPARPGALASLLPLAGWWGGGSRRRAQQGGGGAAGAPPRRAGPLRSGRPRRALRSKRRWAVWVKPLRAAGPVGTAAARRAQCRSCHASMAASGGETARDSAAAQFAQELRKYINVGVE